MKALSLLFCTLLVQYAHSQSAPSADVIQPILQAANLPFTDFVTRVVPVQPMQLVRPVPNAAASPVFSVSDLLWRRITALDLVAGGNNKLETIRLWESLCQLRLWILKADAYANVLFAAYIEDSISMATLASISSGAITSAEAKQVLQGIGPAISTASLLAVIDSIVPNSVVVSNFKRERAEKQSLLGLAYNLSKEFHELEDTRLPKLLASERPASLIRFAASSTIGRELALTLIEYAARGGDLNLSQMELVANVKKLIPDLVGKPVPNEAVEVEALSLAFVMDAVRERSTKK